MKGFTTIEVLFVVAVLGIVIILIGSTITKPEASNPAALCLWKGGVPISDPEGRLVRCDFPGSFIR
jgi:hypothetical protein